MTAASNPAMTVQAREELVSVTKTAAAIGKADATVLYLALLGELEHRVVKADRDRVFITRSSINAFNAKHKRGRRN